MLQILRRGRGFPLSGTRLATKTRSRLAQQTSVVPPGRELGTPHLCRTTTTTAVAPLEEKQKYSPSEPIWWPPPVPGPPRQHGGFRDPQEPKRTCDIAAGAATAGCPGPVSWSWAKLTDPSLLDTHLFCSAQYPQPVCRTVPGTEQTLHTCLQLSGESICAFTHPGKGGAIIIIIIPDIIMISR